VSGSVVSLATLVSRLNLKLFRPFIVVSRQEQRDYLLKRLGNSFEVRVVSPQEVKRFDAVGGGATPGGRLMKLYARIGAWTSAVHETLFIIIPYALRLYRFARSRRIALVHHNNGYDTAAIAMATMLHVPIVAYQRGDEWDSFLVRLVSRWVTKYIANSETTKKSLLSLGIDQANIVTIFPSIDASAISKTPQRLFQKDFGSSSDELCFGIVGMLLPWKGQHIFLRAAKRVLDVIPNARGFVIGDGPPGQIEYRDSLKALAHDLGIQGNVIFTGFREDVLEVMRLLNVVVHASITPEPFGRVIVEAMALKKPIIATKAGGPEEIIRHGETGLLVPPGDVEALADAILLVMTDKTLATKLGETGFRSAMEKFSIDRHVEAVQNVYLSVLGDSCKKTTEC
jgi:glycosyltransferase involved in cell wall biosynthesis